MSLCGRWQSMLSGAPVRKSTEMPQIATGIQNVMTIQKKSPICGCFLTQSGSVLITPHEITTIVHG